MKTLVACGAIFLAGWVSPVAAEPVDYLRDVKPILARHCASCHGAKKPKAGIRLDLAAEALKGGKDGPVIVPGKSDESSLIDAVLGADGAERMPLKRPPLSDHEIATLRGWIDQGAPAPKDEVPSPSVHWSFLSPVRHPLPAVSDPAWGANPIDRFILARLARQAIAPAAEADRITLIRRATLDLIGLPPTPAEVAAFLADDRPDAFDRVVDRLLNSPHFGERWARPWLDLARYADSNGYSIDAPRSIWKYRDWVIAALNRDMPFDQFTIDQIAGDLRPNATLEQRVATGFHRNTPINQEGGIDVEQFRIESVVDRVSTTATVFLGLTMGCAQCHDHKYDPLSQRDFYRFFAFFNTVDEPELDLSGPDERTKRQTLHAQIDAYHRELESKHPELDAKERAWESALAPMFKTDHSEEIKLAFDKTHDMRTDRQRRVIMELFLANDAACKDLYAPLGALRAQEPKVITTMVVSEQARPRTTYIHLGGDFTRKGADVTPGIPEVLPPLGGSSRLNRMDLARWLVDPKNPLTARVTVNRLWQAYFGKGLVETENDFGTQGLLPSHPELLDWLATEFVAQGWSLKAMHRLIVTSKAYRQSSKARPDVDAVDPGHRLLARQVRLRLDAEIIRDEALAVSGLLSPAIGGPSVFPPQPDGVMTLGQMRRAWKAASGPDRYRRGLYTYFWRATPHPSLLVFDAPNAVQACTRRIRSNTPLQALTLLNDQAHYEFAEALAARVLAEAPSNDRDRIRLVFELCLSRSPTETEAATLERLLAREREQANAEAGLPSGSAGTTDRAAWTTAARVLLNLDEFITRE
jgi:mono/diheme cytochrome c family protein